MSSSFSWMKWLKRCPRKKECGRCSLWTTLPGTKPLAGTGITFQPQFLPGYSPDFNPIARLWLRLKTDWFWDFFARTPQELTDRLCTALRSFIELPDKTASILFHPEMIYGNHSNPG